MAGYYYFREKSAWAANFSLPTLASALLLTRFDSLTNVATYTKASVLFFQGTYAVDDKLSVIFGTRRNKEAKKIRGYSSLNMGGVIVPAGVADNDDNWRAWKPKLGVNYEINDNLFTYGSITQGFKSGGYNGTSVTDPKFSPEFITSYETGIKSDWLDKRLRVNANLFHYEFADLQVQSYDLANAAGVRVIIDNAASADVNGLELEMSLSPTSSWRFDVGLSYLDATFFPHPAELPH